MAAAVRTSAVRFVGDVEDVGAGLAAVPATAFGCCGWGTMFGGSRAGAAAVGGF